MVQDDITLADAFVEMRRRWLAILLVGLIGGGIVYVGAKVFGADDEWAASHRLRLAIQSQVVQAYGAPGSLAIDRSAQGEAAFLESSGRRAYFGDEPVGATFKVTSDEGARIVIITAYSALPTEAADAATQLRDSYFEQIVAGDNARFATAIASETQHLEELNALTASGDAPAEVQLERADAARTVAALAGLPNDGSITAEIIGELEGPRLVSADDGARKAAGLAALGLAVLAAFIVGVRGLRAPRVRSAADTGNPDVQRRVLAVPRNAQEADLELAVRVLGVADGPVHLVIADGTPQASRTAGLLRSVGLEVNEVPVDQLASLPSNANVSVLAGYSSTRRAQLRRTVYELSLVGLAPVAVLIGNVPRSLVDNVAASAGSETEP